MTFMATERGRLGRENPHMSLHRKAPTIALAIGTAVLASACQTPTDGARAASATPHVNASVTGGSASFSVHAGTLTSSGAFITGNGSFLPCGTDTIQVPDSSDIPPISITAFCGPPTLNTTGGTELDGGFVSVDYAIPRDTGSVANIEGEWTHRIDVFYPTTIAAVLTASPYAGFHLADWEITGPNGVRLVDSLTIVRPPNSRDTQYIVFFQQGTGSGGSGGTGGGTGTGGGGGGTCLHNCPPPK